MGRGRCFSIEVVSERLEEAQRQGTERDVSALSVLTLHAELDPAPKTMQCPRQHTDSPITLVGPAEPPTSRETPGRAGLFSEPLARQ